VHKGLWIFSKRILYFFGPFYIYLELYMLLRSDVFAESDDVYGNKMQCARRSELTAARQHFILSGGGGANADKESHAQTQLASTCVAEHIKEPGLDRVMYTARE
jgi:hypothetical protein